VDYSKLRRLLNAAAADPGRAVGPLKHAVLTVMEAMGDKPPGGTFWETDQGIATTAGRALAHFGSDEDVDEGAKKGEDMSEERD
jgi:hypothetical protein